MNRPTRDILEYTGGVIQQTREDMDLLDLLERLLVELTSRLEWSDWPEG